MTKKELVKLIREVVKREIKTAVKNEINESLNMLEQKAPRAKKTKVTKNYTENISLNEALNATRTYTEFEAYPEVSANELRNKFASMQSGPMTERPMTDHNNIPVKQEVLEKDGLGKALTRDYSSLVKRFKK